MKFHPTRGMVGVCNNLEVPRGVPPDPSRGPVFSNLLKILSSPLKTGTSGGVGGYPWGYLEVIAHPNRL